MADDFDPEIEGSVISMKSVTDYNYNTERETGIEEGTFSGIESDGKRKKKERRRRENHGKHSKGTKESKEQKMEILEAAEEQYIGPSHERPPLQSRSSDLLEVIVDSPSKQTSDIERPPRAKEGPLQLPVVIDILPSATDSELSQTSGNAYSENVLEKNVDEIASLDAVTAENNRDAIPADLMTPEFAGNVRHSTNEDVYRANSNNTVIEMLHAMPEPVAEQSADVKPISLESNLTARARSPVQNNQSGRESEGTSSRPRPSSAKIVRPSSVAQNDKRVRTRPGSAANPSSSNSSSSLHQSNMKSRSLSSIEGLRDSVERFGRKTLFESPVKGPSGEVKSCQSLSVLQVASSGKTRPDFQELKASPADTKMQDLATIPEDSLVKLQVSLAEARTQLSDGFEDRTTLQGPDGMGKAEEYVYGKEDSSETDARENETAFSQRPVRVSRLSLPESAMDEELPWAMYKARLALDREDEAKQDVQEASDSDSDDDGRYAPQTNDTLPDVYEVMSSLDTDDIDLNLKTTPPPLFESPKQLDLHQRVDQFKQKLAEEEIQLYLDEFEKKVEEEVLMIASLSLDDVQAEERRLREEHINFQQQQAKVQRQRQQEIVMAMERAKKYVMAKYKEKYRELRMREEHMMQKDRTFKDEIHRAFRRSESQLRKALKRRKAEVKTMYGDLTFADGQYGGSKGRRWKVDWNRTPQPIQVKLKCLRGVKDKLPASRYVLMVTLYDRLGGHVMKWSNLKGQQWGGATLPLTHDGDFYNIEMKIDQSVFTVCPSRPDMRPGMVLVFELFILRGSITSTDKVVGWGCFPVCDAEFNVIDGRYRTPMLRGDMDPGIDKFETIEKLMASDLENWLCNVYFEIVKLPRYMAGQKEYEVELQFTSGLLSSPVRLRTGEENVDGEKPVFGSRSDLESRRSTPLASSVSVRSGGGSGAGSVFDSAFGEGSQKNSTENEAMGRKTDSTMVTSKLLSPAKLPTEKKSDKLVVDIGQRKMSALSGIEADSLVRPMTSVAGSRKMVEEKGLQLSDGDSSDGTDYEDDQVHVVKKDEGFKPVRGQPGMFYKVHHNNPVDVYSRKIFTLMPKTPLLTKRRRADKLTHLEELDGHSFAVKKPWSSKGGLEHRGTKKMQFIGRMLLSELGVTQMKSREFWAMIFMLLVTYWMRMYLHYIGQWVFLLALLIPINKFEFLPYTVNLNYQNTLLLTREEIALIVVGPFINITLFAITVAVSAFIQMLFDRFPNIFSRFIMAFGMHCVLDPVWIAITDAAIERFKNKGGDTPIGDAFKLYWHFDRYYNNDNVTLFVSIALTAFLYFVTMFTAITVLYMYFLKIHNNGRLMDVYWRLHGMESSFFLPYDLEMSNEELSFLCRKAEQWRGEEGERRKIAVYDYVWEEEEMADDEWERSTAQGQKKTSATETTTHISIHTLHLDGLRELHRHFLRLPDGAIVEVFGEMTVPGMDEGVKQALLRRTAFDNNNTLRKRSVARKASSASGTRSDSFLQMTAAGSSDA